MLSKSRVERLIGRWMRTASERGLLTCRFDADGRYHFAIFGQDATESGTYRLIASPSQTEGEQEVLALLLRTDEGVETAITLWFRNADMYLDGQRWQQVSGKAQLPATRS